jgi:hypothetical protein
MTDWFSGRRDKFAAAGISQPNAEQTGHIESVLAEAFGVLNRTLSDQLRQDSDHVSLYAALRTEPARMYLRSYASELATRRGIPQEFSNLFGHSFFTSIFRDDGTVFQNTLADLVALNKLEKSAGPKAYDELMKGRGPLGLPSRLGIEAHVDLRRHLENSMQDDMMMGLSHYLTAVRSHSK